MQVVAGLSLKNLAPRFWDPASPYYLPDATAMMVSYGDFARRPAQRRKAMELGLHSYLGAAASIRIYLDNGSFYFLSKSGEVPRAEYEAFVRAARPDWYPIPQDYIPTPHMDPALQRACLLRTMEVNRAYQHDGFVPVAHLGTQLDAYLAEFAADAQLCAKPAVALGGIVPNLLRMPKALSYDTILHNLRAARTALAGKHLHVFGIGGTATLHLAALFGIDSVDSSGWRNRAARGIVQLPGRGDRMMANLGSWRGREPDEVEWELLRTCGCPACVRYGIDGLRASATVGFCNRATHNLWTLLAEARQIAEHLADGTYTSWYASHLDNSIYLPLITRALASPPPRPATE